ncbi:Uma2 family endonuclease [Antarcticirhabdus aurantiaca]|uniref:Uma2 family endonuclease n=2 Tax=Antarcticirhabdus aurantiaca TaxID=2606717 RepID=A0ACD4NLA2_9HYPH|nr:Uma2 family endonuclease [Jeongeuplla avenae]
MTRDRPDTERWQLIDGEPLLMMNPPSGRHQRIAANLERLLNDALAEHHPGWDAIRELGLMIEGRPDFRPVADLVVLPFDLGDQQYFSEFHLVAEVLSPSNTHEMISRKRQLYAESPFCQHILILRQNEMCCEVWSRSADWQGRVYRSAADRIELPEFGFSCALSEVYRGTGVS